MSMRFDIISLFPGAIEAYVNTSILKRAQEDGLIEVHLHQLRDFATDKHQTVDDTPYGGGAGMVLKVEPLVNCLESVLTESDITRRETKVVVTSAKGPVFNQVQAKKLSKQYRRVVLICGRYEGIDERFIEHFCDEELSIGEYILTGGELASLIVVDAVARLLPGVLGNKQSTVKESHAELGIGEYPQYTKPENFRGYSVPEVLLSGHHENINEWREGAQKNVPTKGE